MTRMKSVLVLLVSLSAPAMAQEVEITPMVGWRIGGELEIGGDRARLDDAIAPGVMVSFDRGRGRMLDVAISRQSTTASDDDLFEPRSVDVDVIYLELGGRYLFRPDDSVDPYLGLTLGGTVFTVDSDSSTHLSFAAAAGSDFRLTPRLALRLDGRLHTTVSGAGGELTCDSLGGCVGFAEGASFTQWTASIGLVFR